MQINHAVAYIALFLPDCNNCFFIYLVPYIYICPYYFLILCFYFHLFDTLLTTRHSTIYNVWFDFITSASKLELNQELNNSIRYHWKAYFVYFKIWKGHWGSIAEMFSCFIGFKGKFWLIFTKMHFLMFSYALNTMNLRCAKTLNSHLFTFLDNNCDI